MRRRNNFMLVIKYGDNCGRCLCVLLVILFLPFCLFAKNNESSISQSIERACFSYPQNEPNDIFNIESNLDNDSILVINTVVHVVYNDDEENLEDEQILSQINAVNIDLRMRNIDLEQVVGEFKLLTTDTKIELRLARFNEYGEATNGITRTETSHGPFANKDLHHTSLGGQSPWDQKQFLNIWVAKLAPGVLGYSYYPNEGLSSEGVAIHFENFGTTENVIPPYDKGRTLTHELGHFLGLKHLWGTGGCDSDDGLPDTPVMEKQNSDCALDVMSCGSLDMSQNFMNLAADNCLLFFSRNQAELMMNTLIEHRPGLYEVKEDPIMVVENFSSNKSWMNIYPNPLKSEIVYINVGPISNVQAISLYDFAGQNLIRKNVSYEKPPFGLELEGLKSGVYFVRLHFGHEVLTKKLIYE